VGKTDLTGDGSVSSQVPLALAWLATVLAFVLAVAPVAIFRHVQYDPLIALTAATVIGLAWYTYFTRQGIVGARAREEERFVQSRRAVATAVLAELANSLPRLSDIAYGADSDASLEVATLPTLEHACNLPELFAPETVLMLVEGRRRLRALQSTSLIRGEHRRLRFSTEKPVVSALALRDETQAAARVQFEAGWSYRQLVELVERLSAEGGKMPAHGQPPIRLPQGPLPANPFTPTASEQGNAALSRDDAEL